MVRKGGFSLVEFVAVVFLLSILAVVVPHISRASVETTTSALASDLLEVRSKIELYKLHHNGRLPAAKGETAVDFLRKMTTQTDAKGDPGTDFGPYLEIIPVNPYNNSAEVRIDGAVAGTDIAGWRFDTMTGAFQADDSPDHAMF